MENGIMKDMKTERKDYVQTQREPREAIGRSGGKIILMGEHAVVYGQPAIALPFSAVQIEARVVEEGTSLTVACQFYEGLVHEMPKIWEGLKHAIRFSLYRIGAPTDPAIHIEISSTIPAERGMGSSAAVAVAVARSLFAFYDKPLSQEELWDIVHSSEKIAHGNPSGVDTATTSGGRPIYFVRDKELEELELHLDAYMVVADTGKTGNTLEAIEHVASLCREKQEAADWIVQLGQLSLQARTALASNQVGVLGDLMNQAQGYLQRLGVSDPALDVLVDVALQEGALGAKLTGGGRGGCMIALAKTKEQAKQLAAALCQAGSKQTWIQYLGE